MTAFDDRFDHVEEVAHLLVDSVVDYALFVMDERGFVRTWNRGAERLKGYTKSDIIGEHFSRFYTPPDRESGLPDALLAQAGAQGRVETAGWRVRKDGTRFWAHVTITALHDDDGTVVGFAKVTRDMTVQHDNEEALRRALAREREAAVELGRLSELRTSFLATVAHDLTTPIMVIRSCVELLRDTDGEDVDDMLGAIERNAVQLGELADQLREYSRLDRGKLELTPTTIDLAPELRDIVTDLRPLLAHVAVSIDGTGTIEADALAFRRVMTNLLSNAAEVSPTDGRLQILVRRSDDTQTAVGVRDEGPGLSEEDRDRVFEEFWRGSARRRRGNGLGLGLTIVREYAERHGGRVWVDSSPGRGATFWVSFPAA